MNPVLWRLDGIEIGGASVAAFRLESNWWSQAGSNRRPPACKAGALPAELWPHDLVLRSHGFVILVTRI